VVNVPESAIARESHLVLPTLAGPEIGVASTKAFTTTQLTVLLCLAQSRPAGRSGTLSPETDERGWPGADRAAGAWSTRR
jgi:glucosamine--fructose-6-phosphate aminotransferase (isomerizing)